MPGKERSILAVFFLTIITFGFYWLYWYYKVNEEIPAHCPEIAVAPGLAVITQFIPIVNYISKYNTAERVRHLQIRCGEPGRISPLAALIFAIFIPLGIYTFMIQDSLNRHWRWHRRRVAQAQPVEAEITS